MPIPFSQIPANLLVPGQYGEIDNSEAGTQSAVRRALLMGYKLPSAPAAAGEPIQVLSPARAAELCGHGSPLAIMAGAFLDVNRFEECWLLPVKPPEAGTAWKHLFSVTAGSAGAGAVKITVNGRTFFAAVSAGMLPANAAAAIGARINAELDLPVEAAVEGRYVTVSSLVKGTWGNRNIVTVESEAAGLTISDDGITKGSGVTLLNSLYAALGEKRFHYFVSDFDDTQNIRDLSAELEDRFSATRQIGGRAFVPLSGPIGSASEGGTILAQAREVNSPHVILIPRFENPQLPGEWAARLAAAAIRRLSDDPAANTFDTPVRGLTAGKEADFHSRQRLLESGVATWRLDPTGNVLIERLVTSFTENSDGGRDTSFLDIQIVETVDALRDHINATARRRYRNWKLASTEENFGAGSRVMTPGVFRSFLADMYQSVFILEKQWCQNFEGYLDSIIVEVMPGSKTRLQYSHRPELIGQFLIGAGLIQFR